jgi:FtsH-binding integral membrane protein
MMPNLPRRLPWMNSLLRNSFRRNPFSRAVRFSRAVLEAGLLCAFVLAFSFGLAWVTTEWFFSFWLTVFFLFFTPIWLAVFGLVFATRWRWHELSSGVFLAVFLVLFLAMRPLGNSDFRVYLAFAGGCLGVFATSGGFFTTRLFLSLLRRHTSR